MMKRIVVVLGMVAVAGCTPALSPQVLQSYQSRTLYTCCNLHHETEDISDANYYVGTVVPLGSPAKVQSAARKTVTVLVGGTTLRLQHAYGREQESFQQYLDKVLVAEDPKLKEARFPRSVQDAINDGRVERGMTREQVIMALGYPPTHRTPSLSAPTWTYWYNRWVTYQVAFDDAGVVANVIGQPAPTRNEAIKPDAAPAAAAGGAAAAPKKHHK
jgi:hypothetical protein